MTRRVYPAVSIAEVAQKVRFMHEQIAHGEDQLKIRATEAA